MRDFRELRVWQTGHQFVLAVYRETSGFPESERFGLTSQLRRAAASITANLAEGAGSASRADQRRFFRMALGSACESLNHLLLARDLGLLTPHTFDELESRLASTRRMLIRLIERSGPPR